MTVLCSILCKCKLLTQRLTAKFLLHPQLGGTSGVSECTHVLQVHWLWMYSCLVSARALTSLYRQYRGRQNHCQKLAPDQSGALKKLTSAPTKPLTHNYDHYIMMFLEQRGVYLRDCEAIFALIFMFFIQMTSFWNIVGGMGASLCIPSFMRICELLPPKLHYPEILVLLSLLTEISLPSVQNGWKRWFLSFKWHRR